MAGTRSWRQRCGHGAGACAELSVVPLLPPAWVPLAALHLPSQPPTAYASPATPPQYELLRYAHPDADLASTDLQALQGGAPPPPDGQGPLLGLRLAFTLPASCYATMLIRELTKQPTSVAHHKGMSAAAGAAVTEAGATEAGAAAAGAVGKAEEQG